MAREIEVAPSAPAMLASLRAIGYSFEAALADIIDNSISAEAKSVDVQFRTKPRQYVAIVDDGHGMTEPELVEAMRHGGNGPSQFRSERDLGRFGLGLKTASLSQCRRLTLATVKDGTASGAAWDLDRIDVTGKWTLRLLDSPELDAIPHIDQILAQGHGTIVLWENFDRALAGESLQDEALGELIDNGRTHLALAFHRYINGDADRLRIAVNNDTVRPMDPFLTAKSKQLPDEDLDIEESRVHFQPFILPHLSRMSKDDLEVTGGEEGLRRNQGFYIYRNKRLITYGTWFRLRRQEELTKLARVQVDIPNTLDHLWALDVKKSTAYPPEAIRAGLIRVIERIAGSSSRVYLFRGRRNPASSTPVWERVTVRDGVNYQINRAHPAIDLARQAAGERANHLEQALRTIELTLPIDSIYSDLASERRVKEVPGDHEIESLLTNLAIAMVAALGPDERAIEQALKGLDRVEPFSEHPAIARKILDQVRSTRG
jgi:hypothetical protein